MILIWFHCAVIGLIFFLRFQRHFSFLIYFWSCWVFISAHRLSLVEVSRDLSWLQRRAHCGGFSCCGAQALGTWASVVAAHGLSSCDTWLRCSRHVESSCTRDRTHIPCIGRWILIHCTTREVLDLHLDLYCCVWTLNFPIPSAFGFSVAFHTLSRLWK